MITDVMNLVKHGITTMDGVLHHAPGYILLEGAIRGDVKVTTQNSDGSMMYH